MTATPPPGDPGSAVFSSGYSPGLLPGLPTDPHDMYAPGRTDSRARNAVILGILGIVPLSIVAGVPAIVVGAHALRRIEESDGALRGRPAALTGIALGCLSVLLFVAFLARAYL